MNRREPNKLIFWKEHTLARGKNEVSRGKMFVEPDLGKEDGWTQNQRGVPHLLRLEKNNEGCGCSSICRYGEGKESKELVLSCPCSSITYWEFFLHYSYYSSSLQWMNKSAFVLCFPGLAWKGQNELCFWGRKQVSGIPGWTAPSQAFLWSCYLIGILQMVLKLPCDYVHTEGTGSRGGPEVEEGEWQDRGGDFFGTEEEAGGGGGQQVVQVAEVQALPWSMAVSLKR